MSSTKSFSGIDTELYNPSIPKSYPTTRVLFFLFYFLPIIDLSFYLISSKSGDSRHAEYEQMIIFRHTAFNDDSRVTLWNK